MYQSLHRTAVYFWYIYFVPRHFAFSLALNTLKSTLTTNIYDNDVRFPKVANVSDL